MTLLLLAEHMMNGHHLYALPPMTTSLASLHSQPMTDPFSLGWLSHRSMFVTTPLFQPTCIQSTTAIHAELGKQYTEFNATCLTRHTQ